MVVASQATGEVATVEVATAMPDMVDVASAEATVDKVEVSTEAGAEVAGISTPYSLAGTR